MKKRRTKNTNTESGAIDYCKKVAGTGRYYSFCPNCGWRGDCDELLFDVSEVVIEHVMKAAKRCLRKESWETFEKNIRQKIEIMKSTKDLRACTENGFILQGSAEKEGTEANDHNNSHSPGKIHIGNQSVVQCQHSAKEYNGKPKNSAFSKVPPKGMEENFGAAVFFGFHFI